MIVRFKSTVRFDVRKVGSAVDQAIVRSLYKQAAWTMKTARKSLEQSSQSSAPGTPPHTQTKRLSLAILFEVDKTQQVAVVGPSADRVSDVGAAHEFGGPYHGTAGWQNYPERPFMRPALEDSRPNFADLYRDSIR